MLHELMLDMLNAGRKSIFAENSLTGTMQCYKWSTRPKLYHNVSESLARAHYFYGNFYGVSYLT